MEVKTKSVTILKLVLLNPKYCVAQYVLHCASSENSDQPVHTPNLISVFTGHTSKVKR